MSCLIIDTSTEDTLVSVDQIIYKQSSNPNRGDTVSYLLGALKYLTQSSECSEIGAVLVGTGPGSYTGLRIGLAAAKIWAYAKKLPLVSFNSLSTFAPQSNRVNLIRSSRKRYIAVAFDARGAGMYIMRGDKDVAKNQLIWNKAEIVSWSYVPQFSKSISAVYHPISQKLDRRWNEAGGDKVQWIAQKPRVGEILRAIDQNGSTASWAEQYQEIGLTYNN